MADAKKLQLKPGNRKSFYEKVLDEVDKLSFKNALEIEGIDDEIALLRVQIKAVILHDPENIQLILKATNMLAKLVETRYSISKSAKKGLGEAIKNVIKDIGVPMGVAMITKKL